MSPVEVWVSKGRGSGSSRPGYGINLVEEVAIDSTVKLLSRLYQINFRIVKKVLGPTTDFPIWGSGKGSENPQEI